jgi:hypothetical protein
MAVDQWVPKRFAHLSERLVTQNGIVTMGLAAIVALICTRGLVQLLVVMYSINVFLTFTLSQMGMVRHWWQVRRTETHWRRRLILASVGTMLTAGILVVTSVIKFGQGGWVTLTVTGAFVGLCIVVRSHYQRVRGVLKSLDDVLSDLPMPERENAPELAPDGPTAVVLVESYAGLGIHTLLTVQRMFPRHFKNLVFVSVGLVDSGQFKGTESVQELEEKVQETSNATSSWRRRWATTPSTATRLNRPDRGTRTISHDLQRSSAAPSCSPASSCSSVRPCSRARSTTRPRSASSAGCSSWGSR